MPVGDKKTYVYRRICNGYSSLSSLLEQLRLLFGSASFNSQTSNPLCRRLLNFPTFCINTVKLSILLDNFLLECKKEVAVRWKVVTCSRLKHQKYYQSVVSVSKDFCLK